MVNDFTMSPLPTSSPRASSSQYAGAAKVFRQYWAAYGGFRAVSRSPYFGLALGITAIGASFWWNGGWWDAALSILPNLLGFSLGAYAMLISFSDEKFKKLLAEAKNEGTSVYLGVSASFVHFIIVQTFALIIAVVSKLLDVTPVFAWLVVVLDLIRGALPWAQRALSFIGFFMFAYALALTIATTMSIFRLTNWFVNSKAD